ncbi:MAG: immunoglobulin-like domain-containing protein [Eisenbergiella sp.]
MKRSGKLLDAIGQIDDRYIMEAAEPAPEKETKQPVKKAGTVPLRWRRTAAAFAGLAACAAVAVWTLDQGAAVSPFGAKTEETAAREAAGLSDGATEQQSEAELADEEAVPQAAAELPDEAAVPQAAAELPDEAVPYAYTAEQSPQAAARMASPEQQTGLRSAQAEMPEAAAAKVFASDIQADALTVTCTLVSEDTENTLLFGGEYYLEYLTEDGWQEIAPTGEIIWEDVAYELEPGGSLEKSWDLESAYGALDGGQYRIGIPCEEQNGDGSAAAVIYVEFGI